jgi:hypothetical protein
MWFILLVACGVSGQASSAESGIMVESGLIGDTSSYTPETGTATSETGAYAGDTGLGHTGLISMDHTGQPDHTGVHSGAWHTGGTIGTGYSTLYSGPIFVEQGLYADLDSWADVGAPFSADADFVWTGTEIDPVNGTRLGVVGVFVQAVIPDDYGQCARMRKSTNSIGNLQEFMWICAETSDGRVSLFRVEPDGINPWGQPPGIEITYETWE